jgi:type II secretory pathway predicted ATPase ExeA
MRAMINRFGLARLPFTKEIAAEDLFEATSHTDAITRLLAAVEAKASAVLTGEAGVGKTCVLRGLEHRLNPSRYRVTYLHHATVSPRDFYRQLSMALGLEPKAHPSAMFRRLQAHVEELANEHKVHPVLLLDEAQLMSSSMLEQLHLLLNYRMDSRAFLSVILIGLPELRERLARNLLSSLSARLPVRVHLEPLAVEQVGGYLRHRMIAAGSTQEVFSEDAVLCIREATGGVLRKVDVLAHHCLEVVAGDKGSLVDGGIVQEAVRQCAEALR